MAKKLMNKENFRWALQIAAISAGAWFAWHSYKKRKAASEAQIQAAQTQKIAAEKQIAQVESVRAPDLKDQLVAEGVTTAKSLVTNFLPIN